MHYGNLWRVHRRLMHRFFNGSVVDMFDDKMHQAVNVFLRRLIESPERCLNHAELYVSSGFILAMPRTHHAPFLFGSLAGYLSLSIAYGVNIKSENDEFYSSSNRTMHNFGQALTPGAFLVDTFPIRMNSNRKGSPKGSYKVYSHSKICPGMVPWSQFQEVCEGNEEGT